MPAGYRSPATNAMVEILQETSEQWKAGAIESPLARAA
jgi:hypothetical protein